jgi:CheY-like chemotaxis protein
MAQDRVFNVLLAEDE